MSRIRELRQARGLNMRETAQALGMPYTTYVNYEKGTREPNYETLVRIADFFQTSTDFIVGKPETSRDQAERLLSCPAVSIYNALNEQGQAEFVRYGRYLAEQEEFKAAEIRSKVEFIRHYLTAAAAGYAAPVEGEDYELVLRDLDVPHGADFCIDIDGDSMEPYIKNGQRVYVQQNTSLKEFDAGIFFVDGDVFCKQWCVDYTGTLHLLSANPARQDANIVIPRDSGRNCVCFGKVLLSRRLPPPTYYI